MEGSRFCDLVPEKEIERGYLKYTEMQISAVFFLHKLFL
jgi:hypothetical protein